MRVLEWSCRISVLSPLERLGAEGRGSSLHPPPLPVSLVMRQVHKDLTGGMQGWDSGLPESKPFLLRFDRTLDNFFPFPGA